MAKRRLIDVVMARGLCRDRGEARRMILAGEVRINGHTMTQPAAFVEDDAEVSACREARPVSRAGQKLDYAFARWRLDVDGLATADIGAATGGFTECLLRHGARKVYAIDTGKGQLAWALRRDPRVAVMERTNILRVDALPEPVAFAAIDTSWTPLRRSLPAAGRLLRPGGEAVALLKPNYELQDTSKLVAGVLADREERARVVDAFLGWAAQAGWAVVDAAESPVTGDRGNVEWLVYLKRG